jgi:hypothetical protein
LRYGALMRTTSLALLMGVLGLGVIGCSNKISGSADVTTKEHGDFSIKPDECVSGERQEFFGADLRQGDGRKIIRIISDPKAGYSVKVNIPDTKKAVVVNDDVCSKFDVHVEKQNSTINNIKNVKGRAKLKCKVEGSKVKADLKFENCH